MWLFLDFAVPELNTSTAEVLFGMALTEPCWACENWSLQWSKAEGDQNSDVMFAARHRNWFKPTKNYPEAEGIDQDICGAGVWITPGAVSQHPRGGIAASSLKMQRGVESTVLEKAQIGLVFRKPAKTEMSPLWSRNVQPRGTRNVCGFARGGTVLFPGCRTGGSAPGPVRDPWTHGTHFVKSNQQVLWGRTAHSSEDLQARALCSHLGRSGSNEQRHVRVNFLSTWSREYLEACEMEQEGDGMVGD